MRVFFLSFIAIIMCTAQNQPENSLRFDFGINKNTSDWRIINDGVMGGLSSGQVQALENYVRYTGKISLDNNGGFSSFRSPFSNYNLSKSKQVTIKYKSSGQYMGITLENQKAFYYPYYKLMLNHTNGKWKTVSFSLNDFNCYRLGEKLNQPINSAFLSNVVRVGFTVGNKQKGDFFIEIDFVEFN